MAVPVLLGIPAIIAFFTNAFGKIFEFFARRFTAGVALQLAWVAAYAALVVALAATFVTLIAGISVAMPAPISSGIGLINPGNVEICMSAYFSARLAVWLYDHKVKVLDQKAAALRTGY